MAECERCHSDEGTEEKHPCPYSEEINDNHEPCCNCCADCQHECYMDT